MIKMKGLTHFTIPVKDLKKSKAFYCETLGFDLVRENPHMVFCKCQDDYFVLTYSENPVDPNPGDSHDIHTAFYVDSDEYDRALVYLKENDINVFKDEIRQGDATFTGRSAYFHDPDRNVIELLDSDK
ncbi:MAG: VOC family protein [Rhodospirillaceae bacterium]|jgi:catechol 2,3-dioxygenase-like lactoylglutathione lyase family enzyme|nr:VOC family protein [Rhodospirillaceae bacterium]MBT5456131.1 VOC family protein [Rhodospirillaceae bacterium]